MPNRRSSEFALEMNSVTTMRTSTKRGRKKKGKKKAGEKKKMSVRLQFQFASQIKQLF